MIAIKNYDQDLTGCIFIETMHFPIDAYEVKVGSVRADFKDRGNVARCRRSIILRTRGETRQKREA